MTKEEIKAEKEKQEAEKKALLKDIMTDVNSVITESQKDNVKQADVDLKVKELNEKIEKLDNSGMKELNDSLETMTKKVEGLEKLSTEQKETIDTQGLSIKSLKEGNGKKDAPVTFRKALEDSIMNHKMADKILSKKSDDFGERVSLKDYFTEKGEKTTPVFEVKVAVDMFNTNIAGNYVDLLRLTELDPQRVGIPLTIYQNVIDYMPSKRLNRPTMSLLVAYTYVDGSDTTSEGGTPDQSSVLFKTVEFKSFKVAAYATLGDETLDDLPEALDELAMVMPSKILDKINSQVLGTAGDDSSAIKGMRTTGSTGKCTAFVAATYTDEIVAANIIDLIAKMKLQCSGNKYRADTVWLNPADADNLGALKDQLDNSIMDRRIKFDGIGNPVNVCGLNIKLTEDMTSDQCVVGDNKQTMLGIRQTMEFQIGLSGDNFIDGEKTARISVRMAFAARDKAAFIWSNTVDDDIATITNTPA